MSTKQLVLAWVIYLGVVVPLAAVRADDGSGYPPDFLVFWYWTSLAVAVGVFVMSVVA